MLVADKNTLKAAEGIIESLDGFDVEYKIYDNLRVSTMNHVNEVEKLISDRDIYVQAAKRLGKDVGDVLFLDDNLNADKTAKSAGMNVCGVYDKSSAEYTDEIKEVSDFYIYDFSALLS